MENDADIKTQLTGFILKGHIWNGIILRSKSWKSLSIKNQNNSCLFWIFLDQFPKETRLKWSHCVCVYVNAHTKSFPACTILSPQCFLIIFSSFDQMWCKITVFGIQYSHVFYSKKGNSERIPKRAWLKSSFTGQQRSHIGGKWPETNFHKSLFS